MSAPYINTGGGQTIEPVNKKDQRVIEQIQMVSEIVKVNLYPGFAVVKGEYHMLNTANRPVKIQVGYPPNRSFFRSSTDTRITFGDINPPQISNKKAISPFSGVDQLKVLVADQEIATSNKVITNNSNKSVWGVWDLEFVPGQETVVTVYYMVSTKGYIHEGYFGSKKAQLFTYVLESGQIWRDLIKQGTILISLKGDLGSNDIWGVLPSKALQIDKAAKYLVYRFADLEPTINNNIVINYNDKLPAQFDYKREKAKSAEYYQQIDQVALPDISAAKLEIAAQDNFSAANLENTLAILALVLLLTSPIWLSVILIISGVFLFRKWKSRRK